MLKTTKYNIFFLTAILVSLFLHASSEGLPVMSPQAQALRCERLTDPAGIDARIPRLGWQISGEERGLRQVAYQVLVASSPQMLVKGKGDLWNSGKVFSAQSQQVNYKGLPLKSRNSCYWKVKIWTTTVEEVHDLYDTTEKQGGYGVKDEVVVESSWSQPAFWSMGLLEKADWKARWIGYERGFSWDSISKFSRLSARYFRKEFSSASPVKKATVYIIGPGHYELYVNGHPIGDQVLAEAPTDYTQSVKYNTFDVTAACRLGTNALGVVLGNGRFFTMRPKYKPKKIKEFGFPKLLLQLEIEYANGTRQRIISDDTWKFTADGPIRSNNEYDGEEYDATKEMKGWNTAGFDDSRWLKPELVLSPGGRISAQMNEPIKVKAVVKPISITEQSPGTWILDMGQNMAGWVQMKVRGEKGDKVTLRFGETLQKNGTLYTANLRDAKVTDVYTLKGGGEESWHPVFVFHGFRYVEINGYPGKPSVDDFEGQVVYDDIATIGQFRTSNPLINQIYQNACWGILSNYKGIPLDCPQRNERMPWLGDRAAGAWGESYIFDNENLYAKWLDDIEEAQKPDGALPDVAPAYWNYYSDNMTWPGTYILIAGMLFRQFGDQRPIEKHYASMKKWLDYMQRKYAQHDIMTKDKYGDWCVPPESPELIHSRDSSRNTNGQLIATAYYYRMLEIMQYFSNVLNKSGEEQRFIALKKKVKQAFNEKFLDTRSFRYDNNTVTANLLPLYFGMVDKQNRQAVFNNIVNKIEKEDNGHISTGVIGAQWLMEALTRYGRADLAYRIASNSDYPSWGYMVRQGATTIWELWNGNTANPAMNSHNHIMLLGDLITWCYEDLGGISSRKPGYETITLKPFMPDSLNEVEVSYRTPYGVVKSAWKREGKKIYWNITIPANSGAVVTLPAGEGDTILEGGRPLRDLIADYSIDIRKDGFVFDLGAGSYSFSIQH
jgi:alpha-L-rhamnosidase